MIKLEEEEITAILLRVNAGDELAWNRLLSHAYETLYQTAKQIKRKKDLSSDSDFNTYALLHEACFNIYHSRQIEWRDRKHFYSVMSQAIRYALNGHIRTIKSQKRGGECRKNFYFCHFRYAKSRASRRL